jgi:hypothetical protein
MSAERKQRKYLGEQKGGADNKTYADKVDLNDLDWEDRERVLRLLFSKMNAGIPSSQVRAMNQKKQQEQSINEQADHNASGIQAIEEGKPWQLEYGGMGDQE